MMVLSKLIMASPEDPHSLGTDGFCSDKVHFLLWHLPWLSSKNSATVTGKYTLGTEVRKLSRNMVINWKLDTFNFSMFMWIHTC